MDVIRNGQVVWSFEPFRVALDHIMTNRRSRQPQVVPGDILKSAAGVVGRVVTITPAAFQRWVIAIEPPAVEPRRPVADVPAAVPDRSEPDALAELCGPRVAEILHEQGFDSVDDLRRFVAAGGDISQYKGIGAKAAERIRVELLAQEVEE